MIMRNPWYVPVARALAPRFEVVPPVSVSRLMLLFGVAMVVQPDIRVSSLASRESTAATLASMRTTKMSARLTWPNGNGASVNWTPSWPVVLAVLLPQAPRAMLPVTVSARRRARLRMDSTPVWGWKWTVVVAADGAAGVAVGATARKQRRVTR